MDAASYFAQIEQDLTYYLDYLQGLSREILDSGLSKYPVFIAYQTKEIGMGKQVLSHESLGTRWSVNISIMEEFVKRNVLSLEKWPEFKKTYKDPEQFACVFLMDGLEAHFLYIPFNREEGLDEF